MPRKPSVKVKPVIWLSDEIVDKQAVSNSFQYYEKFQFKNIIAEINDFVLVSNADAAEPDTEEGCDAARILSLYEDSSNKHDPFRAKVQWYSKPADLPNSCLNKMDPISFLEKEVIEDHRPFDTHVSIETFFKKCAITLTFTKDTDINVTKNPYHYICRYRLMAMGKRKVYIEPVMEEERKAIELLCTPMKAVSTPNRTPKTPSSLVKRMSRVSIQEQKNWSVSKNDGTKLLLKRAILADKTEKDSPKKTPKPTPVHTPTDTPRSSKKLTNYNIEEALSMELRENSDDELPTLIIRQHVPITPKRKPSISKNTDETPKKVLVFEEDEKEKYATRSGRVIKNPISYIEEELSPVKRTPRAKSAINHMEEDTTPVKRTPRAASARAKSQIHYMEEDSSPVKQTPRKSVRKLVDQDDDDFKPIPKTPRTPRTPRASKATPAKTPKRSVTRRIMTSELTPSLHPRAHSIETLDDYMKDNKSLPGRENQLDEILSFVRNKLLDGTSGCMYISGVPGTGKTATVCSALKILKDEDDLPDFQLVEVNGMRIAEPRQAYVQIYKQLTGKTVVWEQACSLLEKRFTNPGPRRTPTVLLVDELDALCTRRQDVLYSIMEWAAHSSALLTVLAVANTMDLPERALAARVASRLGLTRLSFAPYTHAQLQAIVASRLSGANVTADAVQLIARKVAAVSGDARRALALCGRALELAGSSTAGLAQVQRALEEAASGAAVRAVRNCCPAERLMLRAVAAEVERTGTDETTLSRALSTAAAIVALDGRPYRSAKAIRAPTPAQAHAICARLSAAKLLLLEPKPSEPRLLLNVSPDDVHYATRQITV
ncbi:origin recognition complex subunit 1 isoform X1 [Ostrinia nubilalis]|uniref:origin recognition complex subunit 1 isoform X1 n=1 Tax=Ostrinia nubilalis TaxID=29057 RepID=UPI0030824515